MTAPDLDLDESTRAGLRELRGPSTKLRAQMLESIWTAVEGPGGPDDPGGSGPGGSPPNPVGPGTPAAGAKLAQAIWVAKIIGATAGLTVVGLLGLRLTVIALHGAGQPDAGAVPIAEPSPTDAQVEDQTAETATELASSTGLDAGVAEREREPAASRARSSRASDRAPANPEPAESARDSNGNLRAELELLRAAEALAGQDPQAALAQLERHRREFSEGVLRPEREALRVELLCSLGRADEAARAGAAIRRTYPGSPLLEGLDTSCAGPAKSSDGKF